MVSLPPLPSTLDPAVRSYLQAIETIIRDLPNQQWRIVESPYPTPSSPNSLLLQFRTGSMWVTKKALAPDGTWI